MLISFSFCYIFEIRGLNIYFLLVLFPPRIVNAVIFCSMFKVKCIQYWPDEDKMETGSMRLEVVEIETFAEFTIRTFSLINVSIPMKTRCLFQLMIKTLRQFREFL